MTPEQQSKTSEKAKKVSPVPFLVAIVASFIGYRVGIDQVAPRLIDHRFPSADFGSFVMALNRLGDGWRVIAFSSFLLSIMVGGAIYEKRPVVAVLAGLTAGVLMGALAMYLYFYHVYDW
jgi:hypothetical protein